MKEELYKILIASNQEFSLLWTLETMCIALGLALIIYLTYRLTFSGVLYNKKFNISLVMLTLITTMVMLVISNNLSLSLGMVGALSIVRFRTAIKDPRDTAYVFWCIAVGLCTGAGNFALAIVGTLFIAITMIIVALGGGNKEERFLLIVRGERRSEEEIMKCIFKAFKHSEVRAKNSTGQNLEIIYQVKIRKNDDKGIINQLHSIEGVTTANLIAQNGETIG